jgi:hypothetical protein
MALHAGAESVSARRWGYAESFYVVVIIVLVSLLLALLGGLYYWANWNSMADSPCPVGSSGVGYSFSVSHGFTCTSANGRSLSKWWW